jgi:NTE family protein
VRKSRNCRRINLALQGGGAHGAFTWGVLDRLLEEEDIAFGWISGTSAGAVNAVAVASGLAAGGRDKAQAKLRSIWEAVEQAGVPDLIRSNPFLLGLTRAASLSNMPPLSPYDFNPLGFDPLRRLLTAHVDFEALRSASPVSLLIAATDALTGRARLFRQHEMTVEAVLASACLPTLHHAVVVDGRAYWDGGFSANPDVLTLASESPVRDTLIVQLNPAEHRQVPRTAREIAGRVSAITFNQPLLRDIEAIVAAQETRLGWFAGRNSRVARLKRHRFHLIEAGRYTAGLSADSKLRPEKALLAWLRDAGRLEAQKWLERCSKHVGRRSTVDLKQRYLSAASPPSAIEAEPQAPAADSHPAGDRA